MITILLLSSGEGVGVKPHLRPNHARGPEQRGSYRSGPHANGLLPSRGEAPAARPLVRNPEEVPTPMLRSPSLIERAATELIHSTTSDRSCPESCDPRYRPLPAAARGGFLTFTGPSASRARSSALLLSGAKSRLPMHSRHAVHLCRNSLDRAGPHPGNQRDDLRQD